MIWRLIHPKVKTCWVFHFFWMLFLVFTCIKRYFAVKKMVAVNRILKFLWLLSLLFFFANLFYGYYVLPDVVCTQFDAFGNPVEYTDRKNVFYFFIGVVGILNILITLLEKTILMIPNRYKPVPNKVYWLSSDERQSALNFILSDWLYSLGAIFNLCITYSVFVFWLVNTDIQKNILSFTWLLPTIAVILLITLIYLPIRLTISKIFIR